MSVLPHSDSMESKVISSAAKLFLQRAIPMLLSAKLPREPMLT